jgi:hypothetical protein
MRPRKIPEIIDEITDIVAVCAIVAVALYGEPSTTVIGGIAALAGVKRILKRAQ